MIARFIAVLAILMTISTAATAQTTKPTTQPSIVEQPAMELAGIATYGKPMDGAFGKLWDHFQGNVDGQPGLVSVPAYGVALVLPAMEKSNELTYFAGEEVKEASKVPAFLLRVPVPAGMYAVFPLAHGMPEGIKELPSMYMYIFQEWLPTSGYEIAAPMNLERYDSKANTIELLIPVRKKQ